MRRGVHYLAVALGLLVPVSATAQTTAGPSSDGAGDSWRVCGEAIAAAEKAAKVPRKLLLSIALVESGRRNDNDDGYSPWPWTVNAGGQGRHFQTKDDAVAAVRELKADRIRNIDVGCMQVNLKHHPKAFGNLGEALDPSRNAAYAARLLRSLFRETGTWGYAVGRDHSSVYRFNRPYRVRVMRLWHQLRDGGGSS
jgi:soluble lytic murein transglycosylase-like protein